MEGGEEKMTMGERYAQNNITVRIYKVKTNIWKDRGISLCNSNGENLSVKPKVFQRLIFTSFLWSGEMRNTVGLKDAISSGFTKHSP